MANPLDFLQLTPENIAQAKGMGWGQALKTDLASGYNPRYTGKGATGLGGYIKSGFQSLAGNVPASGGVGGATPLTRKLALTAMNYAPKALGIASKFLGPASFLFNTSAVADATMPQYGSEEYKAFMAREALFRRKQKQTKTFKKIREKELADAARQKDAADAAAAARKKQQQQTIAAKGTAQGSGGVHFSGPGGSAAGYGGGSSYTPSGSGGHFYIAQGGLAQRAPRYANGGLIDFYRYGGFSG